MKEYKNYKRSLIQIDFNTAILIHIFEKEKSLIKNIELSEEELVINKDFEIIQNSAKQFFQQLEGNYSDLFLESIILEAAQLLKESDARRNNLSKFMSKEEDLQIRAKEALDKAYKLL